MPDDITNEFAHADLKDVRRSRRLVRLAEALAKSPAASISAACGGWAETMAAFRLLNGTDFEPRELITPHVRSTAKRCTGADCVVVAQDTTEFDFSHMKATEGLGPLNENNRRGFFMHSSYVVSEQGLPMGLLDAEFIWRDDDTFRSAGTRKKKHISEKESRRWLAGYHTASKLARELPGTGVISVSDREGDIYEVFEAWSRAPEDARAEWIIRATQDRALLNVVGGGPSKLFAALEAAAVLGEIEFEVRAKRGTKKLKGNTVEFSRGARTVRQTVRMTTVEPRPPYRRGTKLEEVAFRAILAEEAGAPAGEEPVRWILLTSMEVATLEDARRIINLYQRRWDMEVFHRVLKTGCRVEQIQLKTGQALVKAVMIYLVVAWRILYLTHLGRRCPDLPCGCVFEEAEWKSACAVVKRKPDAGEPTLSEFIGIVGRLGGHLGRKGDGDPGPQSIWQGLARVRDFACVWQVIHDG